ncbi:hypothetical protein CYMTET_17515 [Cymbomonas tetramitiformis]|uniref:Uncharacterized protein n=1 Tax=Cymbomonas tetramitiformis TaxID=36881 RepID=A0AAE0G9Y8_9CHLO|nr:hypothetical protein CYMTET_17515 [Cymbomonas tetramitiformis]
MLRHSFRGAPPQQLLHWRRPLLQPHLLTYGLVHELGVLESPSNAAPARPPPRPPSPGTLTRSDSSSLPFRAPPSTARQTPVSRASPPLPHGGWAQKRRRCGASEMRWGKIARYCAENEQRARIGTTSSNTVTTAEQLK